MATDFEDLQQITALLEERALARHRTILDQETALRQELAEIESLRHKSLRQDDHAHARRMLGADGLWQGWLAERRMRLNQDLAMLQVRKGESQTAAQMAFARNQVTADLSRQDRDTARRKRQARSERRLEELSFSDFSIFSTF
jgi:hypothetical protein